MPTRQSHDFTNSHPNVNSAFRAEVERALKRLQSRIVELQAEVDAIDTSGGGGAPIGASYVTASAVGLLTNERVLTQGTGITVTDNGANSTIVIASTVTQVTQEQVDDWVGNDLVIGSDTVEWSYDDPSGTLAANVLWAPRRVLYEVNFASLANLALVNGNNTIDGLTWTGVNLGATVIGTADILNGAGLRFIAGTSLTSATTFTASTRNCAHIYLPVTSIPNWDGRSDLLVEIYMSTLTLEINGDSVVHGVFAPSGAPVGTSTNRCVVARISNQVGSAQVGMTQGTTSTNGGSATGINVIGLKVRGDCSGDELHGTWAAGWPAQMQSHHNGPPQASLLSSLWNSNTNVVIGLGTGLDASPTTRVIVERMRISEAA